MLSYQHIYHAGNVVDCQKHALLCALCFMLDQTDQHYDYLDTHSGRGLYDLTSFEAGKIAEYRDGIDRIWSVPQWPQELARYQALLEELNPDGFCRYYPGSPMVAHACMDAEKQHLDLYELHPQEWQGLQQSMSGYNNVALHHADGWQALQEKPSGKIILIDPSYELKDEYASIPQLLKQSYSDQNIYMIWYPILKAERHQDMIDAFQNSGITNILQTEIMIDRHAKGLIGTGMLLFNPPHGFEDITRRISEWLTGYVGQETKTGFIA